MSTERVVIDGRCCGPPGAANGGWVCGLLAERLPGGPVEVTLRRPVPLEQPLDVVVTDEGAELHDSGELLAAARRAAAPDVGEIPAAGLDAARSAALRPQDVRGHPFPGCFGCGPERDPAEAVALHPGPVSGVPGLFATTWTPGSSLPQGADGGLHPANTWVALDCPTGMAAAPPGTPPHVLGRLTGEVLEPPRLGEELLVLAWTLGSEGRKRWSACALVRPGGAVVALSRATWIALAG
ncbi:MAG: hypothetical protein MUC84_00930 [Solirubrobacteraceae bacterium]|nr:hypothetical protein [Solirubrobacteraceae bacterium]